MMLRPSHASLRAGAIILAGLISIASLPNAAAQATSKPPARQAAMRQRYNDVLRLAPREAWLVFYTANLSNALRSPIVEQLLPQSGNDSDLAKALAGTIDGPVMVAISGAAPNPFSWSATVAARTELEYENLCTRLQQDLVPAWNRSSVAATFGTLTFSQDDKRSQLHLTGLLPITVSVANGTSLLLGASGLNDATTDANGSLDMADSFVSTTAFARLVDGRSSPIGTLAYVDLRPFVPMALPLLNDAIPNLYDALRLDLLQDVGLIGGMPVVGNSVRLSVGLSGPPRALWGILASPPTAPELAAAYPEDTSYFLYGSMDRASDLAGLLWEFTDRIDPQISQEYQQERAEFRKEAGIDFETGLLANLVDGWAIGGRVRRSNPLDEPMLALKLANPALFQTRMHTLKAAFDLKTSSTRYRDVAIEKAQRAVGPFCYAVVGEFLLVASSQETIETGIYAVLEGHNLSVQPGFEQVRRRAGDEVSKLLYVDLARFLRMAIAAESDQGETLPESVVAMSKSQTVVALALSAQQDSMRFDLVTNDGRLEDAISILAESFKASVERARFLSVRLVSTSNVKGLAASCQVYAANHDHRWPVSLEQLIASGTIGDPSETANILSNPYDGAGAEAGKSFYLYRFVKDAQEVSDPSTAVVISEPRIHHGGAVFGFLDGHAEWIEGSRAEELLSIMRAAQ